MGIGKDNNFASIATKTITNFGSNTGVGTDAPGAFYASSTNASAKKVDGVWTIYLIASPSSYQQAFTRAAIKKNKQIYAIQFKVYSTTADTSFSILNIQAKGLLLRKKIPSSWTS